MERRPFNTEWKNKEEGTDVAIFFLDCPHPVVVGAIWRFCLAEFGVHSIDSTEGKQIAHQSALANDPWFFIL
jgi:hypothetical protein